MKNLDKRTWISIFIIVCCISIFIIILFNVKNIDKISVFAEEKVALQFLTVWRQ